jgi:hypothetical protein
MDKLNSTINYITTYIEPLLGLFIGICILCLVGYINWRRKTKENTIQWIAKHLFDSGFRSQTSADGLFMTITSFLLLLGGYLVIRAYLYLTF